MLAACESRSPAELAFAARTVRRMSGGSAGRKGCEARHNQLVCPLGQLSFDARQGHAAREMRATVRLRCGARARVVWVWCCTTQRHPATNRGAMRYEAADGEAMVDGKDEMGGMDGVDETGESLVGWMGGWMVWGW